MEQRRFPGNSHWYHETQSTLTPHAAPLVPEAADIEDRFLLGLAQTYRQPLKTVLDEAQAVLTASRETYPLLMPAQVATRHTHTLSLYDRLSTALTVAQVTGIQRLCNHYAARLNPLSGPDSSRESNHRLTQITEYARLLASQPTLIDAPALARLDEVSLTAPDIITLNQIVGFVSYQARFVAGLGALLALPVRWIPGVMVPEDADAACFENAGNWEPKLAPVEMRYASARQLETLTWCQQQTELNACSWLLAHDAEALYGWRTVFSATDAACASPEGALAAAVAARINGSAACFARYPDNDLRKALQQSVETALNYATQPQKEIIQCAAQLTRSPERFNAAHLQPLREADFDSSALMNVIQATAFSAWNNRLMHALGSTAAAH